MKKVAIIGHGYVGQAVERYFDQHYHRYVYDPVKYPERFVHNFGRSDGVPDLVLGADKDEINE
jgi:hypothetical protein